MSGCCSLKKYVTPILQAAALRRVHVKATALKAALRSAPVCVLIAVRIFWHSKERDIDM